MEGIGFSQQPVVVKESCGTGSFSAELDSAVNKRDVVKLKRATSVEDIAILKKTIAKYRPVDLDCSSNCVLVFHGLHSSRSLHNDKVMEAEKHKPRMLTSTPFSAVLNGIIGACVRVFGGRD